MDDELAEYARELDGVWEHAEATGNFSYRMSEDDFYFYHIAHIAKHFLHGGCGIRPISDVFVLKRAVGVDCTICRDKLERVGLLKFARNIEALADAWFGGAESTDTTVLIGDYIIGGGVFGSAKNRVAVSESIGGGRARYLLSRLIAPRDKLEGYYPILKKHPILLPVAQVRRWFRVFSKGNSKSRSEIGALSKVTAEEKLCAKKLLDAVGLGNKS